MSKINSVPADGGDNKRVAVSGDALVSAKFNPKTGVRLAQGVTYYFPDMEDFRGGKGFYTEQPNGFDEPFYGINLSVNGNTTSVPLGVFFRDRVSVSGKIADFDGNLRLVIKPVGFITDIVRNAIGGSLNDLATAICTSGFTGFKVDKVIEVPCRKYGTENEIAPREVYQFVGVK